MYMLGMIFVPTFEENGMFMIGVFFLFSQFSAFKMIVFNNFLYPIENMDSLKSN